MVVAETEADAARAVGDADAAFGTLPDALIREARRLRWLQAPRRRRPPATTTRSSSSTRSTVTNFREIYNDHIGAHIMAFVLAFARGLHAICRGSSARVAPGGAGRTGVIHLPAAPR